MDNKKEVAYSNLKDVIITEIDTIAKRQKMYMNKNVTEGIIDGLLSSVYGELKYHEIGLDDENMVRELSLVIKSLLNQKILENSYDYTAFKYIEGRLLAETLRDNHLFIIAIALNDIINHNCKYNELQTTLEKSIEKKIEQHKNQEDFIQKLEKYKPIKD